MKTTPSSFEACPLWEDFPDIDLYMDQVISILERRLEPFPDSEEKSITPTMINNYVKHKILSPPVNKRYGKTQLTSLFMPCILKRFMQLSDGAALIENLVRLHGEEGAYRLFSEELTRAMSSEAQGSAPCDATHAALRGACVAFAAITFAKISYLAAEEEWRDAAEKKLLREKKEKEKTKDKAKDKEKEKAKDKSKEKAKEKEKSKKEKK